MPRYVPAKFETNSSWSSSFRVQGAFRAPSDGIGSSRHCRIPALHESLSCGSKPDKPMGKVLTLILCLWDFTRSYDKRSWAILKWPRTFEVKIFVMVSAVHPSIHHHHNIWHYLSTTHSMYLMHFVHIWYSHLPYYTVKINYGQPHIFHTFCETLNVVPYILTVA